MAQGAAGDDFIVFGAPNLGQEEADEVLACLKSGWIGTGPRVQRFEEEFGAYRRAPYAAALGSCTAALHLSLVAAGIGEGDEVITTPLTFCATVNAILHAGATPVLADVDPVTMNLDPARVAERITPRTKAILPVHFAGRPCDMDRLMALAAQHSLVVIEDCAHAIETEYRGQAAGTFGAFGCFSFYATKNLTTGEGGMVLTRRREDHERIKTLSLHGLSLDASKRFGKDGYKHYQVTEAGFKYNLTDLQASLGIHQLHKIEAGWLRRKAIWERYLHEFAALPLALPAPFEPGTRHALHLFTVGLDERRAPVTRDQFLTALGKRGIGVGVHYVSVPEHAFYQATLGWKPEEWPQAHALGRHTASLPLSPKLTDAEVDRVVAAVKAVVS